MKRREFITLLGGAATAPSILWPLTAHAQGTTRKVVGFLGANTAASQRSWTDAPLQRLNELGWTEGRNLGLEYRWAEGRSDRSESLIAELLRLKVDLILTHGTPNAAGAKKMTSSVPVVFASVGDPVGTGLVASLARPGGNLTGLSNQTADLGGKRLDLLRDVIPNLRRLGIMANVDNPANLAEVEDIRAAAGKQGLDVVTSEIRSAEDIAPAIDAIKGRADALYAIIDPLVITNRVRVSTLVIGARLPTISGFREFAEAGGLMCYGANTPDLFRRAAEFVDKILRGAKPGDLPVEQPTKFDIVINLTTAKILGLTIPESFLLRADEVIE
jgi:putative ABC transport system substrate-binding protein